MRLSDIKGERTLDVLADIIEPIANIAEDENTAKLFKREKLPEGMSAKKYLLDRAKKSAPALLKSHKSDIIAIFAAIEGTSAEDYAESLNPIKLINDLVELLSDKTFTTLFISAQSSGSSSSSAQASIEDSKV